ncbi:transposase [Candidatus Microgenomates bacterium]|nr:MAG: transposase [Candidatus Microgenomates bacterium]
MPFRTTPFVNGEYYHIYNRGLEKQVIFNNRGDYFHFLETIFYYQIQNPKPKYSQYRVSKIFPIDPNKKIVDIISYCLMPNHFHLFVKQIKNNGISEFMRKSINSFTKYRNTKYNRQGPLFKGMFNAVRVENDEQLIHLSRYIHLNPLVSYLVKNLNSYEWSSYPVYINLVKEPRVQKGAILNFFKSSQEYQKFVLDQEDYGKTLELLKHLLLKVKEEEEM